MAVLGRTQLASYVRAQAPRYGLDPAAVLAVASQEGAGGGIGDQGTSFGPWQLHYGGAFPSSAPHNSPEASQAWAWSTAGVDYALSRMAAVASGQRGEQAIQSIVTRFERPQNPAREIAGASRAYGVPVPAAAPDFLGGTTNYGTLRPGVKPSGGGGSFWSTVEGGVEGAAGAVVHGAEGAFGWVEGEAEAAISSTVGFLKAMLWLVNPKTWLRAVETVFGVMIAIVGVGILVGADDLAREVMGARAGGAASEASAAGAAAE